MQFLRIATGLTTALGALHTNDSIHKDVKPTNVLVNRTTGQVRLTGFGVASRLPCEGQAPEHALTACGRLFVQTQMSTHACRPA